MMKNLSNSVKLTRVGCNVSYVDETTRRFGASWQAAFGVIRKNFQGSETCKNLCSGAYFSIFIPS